LLTTVALGVVGVVVYLRMKTQIMAPYGHRLDAEQRSVGSAHDTAP